MDVYAWMYSLSNMYKVLTLLLLVLAVIMYIVYFYTLSITGYYVVEVRVENTTVDTITIDLPLDEHGEPVYRITKFTSAIYYDSRYREIEPIIVDEVNGYPKTIALPVHLSDGKYTVCGEYVLEEKDYFFNYTGYPWKLASDGGEPIYVYPRIERHITYKIIGLIKQYGAPIVYTLSTITCGLAVYTIYLLGRGGLVFQEKPVGAPPAGAKPKKCDWCSVCVRFFKIDTSRSSGSQLPYDYVSKLMDLLSGVNRIWEKCCIRFYPCIDGNGKVYARTIDPRKTIEVPVLQGFAEYRADDKTMGVKYKVVQKLDASEIFSDGSCRSLVMDKGGIAVDYEERVVAKWDRDGEYRGTKYRKDTTVPSNVLKQFLKDVIDALTKARRPKSEIDQVRDILEKIDPKKKHGKVNVFSVLESLVKSYGYGIQCIDVFIIGSIDEKTTEVREDGYGAEPGRIVIISSRVVDQGLSDILAHELGHNLSLGHVQPSKPPNLMEPSVEGISLTKEQCMQAHKECMGSRESRKYSSKTCDGGDKYLGKYMELKDLINKRKNARNELVKLNNELANVGKKSRECRKKLKDLRRERKYKKYVYDNVKPFVNKLKRSKGIDKDKLRKEIMDEINGREKDLREYMARRRPYRSVIEAKRKWIDIFKWRLKALDDPDGIVEQLKKEIDRVEREIKECIRYLNPEKVKRDLKERINELEKSIEDMDKRIHELEEGLKKAM